MTDSPLPSDFLASTKTNRVGKTTYKRRTRPPIASSSIYEENDPVQVPVHSQLAVKPAAQNKNKRGKMVSQENEIARESIREPPQSELLIEHGELVFWVGEIADTLVGNSRGESGWLRIYRFQG